MNLKLAIDDMKKSIEGLSWSPTVRLEQSDKGAANLVTIVPAGVSEEFRFGEVKRTYTLAVQLFVSGKDTTPATVQKRCQEINSCLGLDRKRGGNALTTIVAPWTDEEVDGRNQIIMASEPQIQLIESC
jgi:hypothetical protein